MNELLTMLDSKYKRLEYIQSTGTQWIDLGLTANQDTTIKCRISNVNSGTQSFIGLVDTGNLIYGIGQQSENNYLYGQYHKSTSSGGRILSNIAGNDGEIRNFELRKNEFYIDNALIGSITYFTFTTTNTLKLFTSNPSSSISSIKMYNAQVLDGNMNLLRNMIPVIRKSDNEIGMLDLVEGKFYTNAGTGKFTANLDTMYAIIQGTPTVQDGRVSGFSSSNYLEIQSSLDLTQSYEIQITFTTSNNISSEQFILADTESPSPIGFGIFTNSQFVVYYMNTNGQRVYSFIDDLSANTKYKVNLKYSKREHKFYVYINGVKKVDVASAYSYSNRYIRFGVSRLLSSVFNGTIDLNRSYIKIDDTKYKLQAVVGYTIVGSPTITDGVVSGFSTSDCLSLQPPFNPNNNPWKVKVKITTSSSNNQAQYIFRSCLNNTELAGRFGINLFIKDSKFELDISTNGTSWLIEALSSHTVLTNTTYWIIFGWDGKNYYLDYSFDNQNYVRDINIENNKYVNINLTITEFGRYRYNNFINPFLGSIDLNETYIKLNNKLWFNGLPNN